ncbi:MAG: type III PLP-dependent enzyme [Novosphingobium sp.]
MNEAERDGWLERAAERFGTPAYVYLTDPIEARIGQLNDAFDDRFALSFAAKSNPNPGLLRWLNGHIGHLDVSSIGEFRLAVEAGWEPARISFTGPGKREFELREALGHGLGLLVIESLREARLANAVARRFGRVQPVLIRIAPDTMPKGFGDQLAGRPSAFGIDLEVADQALEEIAALASLRIAGFHIYAGTQCLKPAAIAENYRTFLAVFEQLCAAHELTPETLIFGAGLGIAYHDHDTPLDLGAVADDFLPDLDAFRAQPRFRGTRLVLELGRYLVAEAGYFVTRVISTKASRGTRIAICDGGMNNHLAASGLFGMVIRRNYRMHKVGGGPQPVEKVDLVGPLCTSIDRLASGVELPHLEEGDLLAVHNSGAYGLTSSPIHFISHRPPAEVIVDEGTLSDVSRDFGRPAARVTGTRLAEPSR